MSYDAKIHAQCSVVGATAAFTSSRNVTSCVRNVAGHYTITCDEAIDAAQVTIHAQPLGTGDTIATVNVTGDGVIDVRLRTAGALADVDFQLTVFKIPGLGT
jgi:hypothetical protein